MNNANKEEFSLYLYYINIAGTTIYTYQGHKSHIYINVCIFFIECQRK